MIIYTRENEPVEVVDIDYSQAPYDIKILEAHLLDTDSVELNEEDLHDLKEFNYDTLMTEWLDNNALEEA